MTPDQTPPMPDRVEILVVGAGMAGLTAARALVAAGRQVLVVDKGYNPGGRMATRRLDEAIFDHGTTFITAAGGRFAEVIHRWQDAGAMGVWQGLEDGVHHWRGLPDNRGLAEYLARGLSLRTRTRLVAVGRHDDRWQAKTESGASVTAAAVLMTPPVPQILELLDEGGTDLDQRLRARLDQVHYQRCLVVMAVLAGPSNIPPPGLLEPKGGPIGRLVDERAKGTSPVPAVTIHADAEFSRKHWDDDHDEVASKLLAVADPWLGSRVVGYQVHGWKFGRPERTWPEPCLVAVDRPLLVLAGDAFGGPDVPGAYGSGLAAAEVLGEPPGHFAR